MLITVFRSRLKPEVRDEYGIAVARMNELAQTMPGYEHEEGLRTWRTNSEHRVAQKMARERYYTEYHIQVCTLDRESKFAATDKAAAQT